MAELLFEGCAHAPAASVASTSPVVVFRIAVGVIATKARTREVFHPVMIRDVYHHVP